MADYQVVKVEEEDAVAPSLRALHVVGERPYAGDEYVPHLELAGAIHNIRLAFHRGNGIMAPVVVADRDYIALLVQRTEADALIIRVGDDNGIFALDAETGMA